tara:strand:- start:502 stop:783 length:282 start_codon:yes stop_codon:yes gene_type:complete
MDQKNYIYLSTIKYEVLKFITSFIEVNKFSPTYLDIARKFRFSRARAGKIVRELFLIGLITKGYSAHRNIRMTEDQMKIVPNLNYNKEYKIND